MGGRRPVQAWIRRLVHLPVIGHALYRLNVMRPVVAAMYRGHVYGDPARVTPEFLDGRMRVVRQPGARFASACFVTGALDPFPDRAAFLEAARRVRAPMLIVYGSDTPPRSRAEMEALAGLPGVERRVLDAGALGVHEERPDAVAAAVGPFLRG
jgi:pimeloyl-ACP methyl ester carboxylesterase